MLKNVYYTLIFFTATLMLASNCAKHPSQAVQELQPNDKTTLSITNIRPAIIQTEAIEPGLQATYYLKYFKRDVNYLQKMREGEFDSFRGKPITQLNHQFERNEVFNSGTNRGVAIQMRGYLHFPDSGTYQLQALSNDGILLYISDNLCLNDPRQHADRMSNIASIAVTQPGWYPLAVDYFQRKGTAALKLFWKTPGSNEFAIIPASAYGNRK